jgi:hypothetical protein
MLVHTAEPMNQFKDHQAQSSAEAMRMPSHGEIAVRAYQLWLEQGQGIAAKSHSLIAKVYEQAGSVQA